MQEWYLFSANRDDIYYIQGIHIYMSDIFGSLKLWFIVYLFIDVQCCMYKDFIKK